MRVDELRQLLKGYEKETIIEIAVELYKRVSKQAKEEYGIDETLSNFTEKKSLKKKPAEPIPFDELCDDVWTFVINADNQYYFSKRKDRAKWRFKVKEYINALIDAKGENSDIAAVLLIKIYRTLSYGCGHWIFNTDNPFRSVGYSQGELLGIIINKLFYGGVNNDNIRDAIALTLECFLDDTTLRIGLIMVLIGCLKSPESKEIAIQQCGDYLKTELGARFAADGLFKARVDEYRRESITESAVELCFHLRAALYEYGKAISVYWKDTKATKPYTKEVALYRLLSWLEMYEEVELWIREYEAAVRRGIKPRDNLETAYKFLKESGSFEEMNKKIEETSGIVYIGSFR